MTVMPGIIDVHAHIQFSRAGKVMPKDYAYKLWLVHGITTIRDPGSMEGIDTIVAHARLSADNKISAPTIIPYAVAGANTPDEAHALVRRLKHIICDACRHHGNMRIVIPGERRTAIALSRHRRIPIIGK